MDRSDTVRKWGPWVGVMLRLGTLYYAHPPVTCMVVLYMYQRSRDSPVVIKEYHKIFKNVSNQVMLKRRSTILLGIYMYMYV